MSDARHHVAASAAPTFRAVAPAPPPELSARIVVYNDPLEPPHMEEISDSDAAVLVERLYEAAARRALPPVLALREIIENLIHADFQDALISVLDDGHRVRVSDSGPGIADPALALQPGYSTAGAREREVVRGVGSGLPLAAQVIDAEGGELHLDANLGGGTVVTLSVPVRDGAAITAPDGGDDRMLMALLLEMGPSLPEQLAPEMGWTIGRCGRELVALEARALVTRHADGTRSLTEAGAAMLATLF